MALACSHILRLTNELSLSMCDVRWWNNYLYHFGRKEKLTSVFENAIQNTLPGVPWRYVSPDEEVLFPVAVPGTSEEHRKDMLFLFENFDRCFLKGAPRQLSIETNLIETSDIATGLETSVKCSQALAKDYAIGSAKVATLKSPTYQDLMRKFEAVYKLAEEDTNDLIQLNSILDEYHTTLLGKHEKKNIRSSDSEVVSLLPSLDKKRKSRNLCNY
jgi:hypothetical protein